MGVLRLITTVALCLAPLAPLYGDAGNRKCFCPKSPLHPNPELTIVDAAVGAQLGDSCDLSKKKTTFEKEENVQLRLVVKGGQSLNAGDAQIVVKWTDPDGEVTWMPSLCLKPSDAYRTCARKSASKQGQWEVAVTDCGRGNPLRPPLKFQVTK